MSFIESAKSWLGRGFYPRRIVIEFHPANPEDSKAQDTVTITVETAGQVGRWDGSLKAVGVLNGPDAGSEQGWARTLGVALDMLRDRVV